jgi:hypothetical protein
MRRSHSIIIVLVIGLLLLSIPRDGKFGLDSIDRQISQTDSTSSGESMLKSFGSQFYENKGQFGSSDVNFYGRFQDGVVGFSTGSVTIWSGDMDEAITLRFMDSRIPEPEGKGIFNHRTNFLLGSRGMYTDIRGYESIFYNDVWPGIDIHYKITSEGLKYELEVNPGVDPDIIKIACEGIISLQAEGNRLELVTPNQKLVDDGLVGFQAQDTVELEFVLFDQSSFGFSARDYDTSRTLIIDPLIYSSYVGGTGSDYANAIEVDLEGNAYVVGHTWTLDFPTERGAQDTFGGGYCDAFVLKLDDSGNNLVYATFIGGAGNDYADALAVDQFGNAYVTGRTASADFPFSDSIDSTFNGGLYDCFIFKLNSDGDELIYSSFIGGEGYDAGQGVTVTSTGYAYLTGVTASQNFPILNPYDGTYNGGDADAFILGVSPSGRTLEFATFFGGTGEDSGTAIVADQTGVLYLTGYTSSLDMPTIDPIDETNGGGASDCYIMKITSDGSQLLFATYAGGEGQDRGNDIKIDESHNIFIVGTTWSSDFFQEAESPAFDVANAFVLKVYSDTNQLAFSRLLGGSDLDEGYGIAIGPDGNVTISGTTKSANFTIFNPHDGTHNGGFDSFVAKISSEGGNLLFSTFLGGAGHDTGRDVAVGATGTIYVVGFTSSIHFPTSNIQEDFGGGNSDAFVYALPDPEKAGNDTDQDGLSDIDELTIYNTNHTLVDSDFDTLSDGDEVYSYHTNPNSIDSDGDTMSDSWEVYNNLNPLIANRDLDPDNDGLTNLEEYQYLTDPNDEDSDGDRLSDFSEVITYTTNPNTHDSDLDGVKDYDEIFTYATDPRNNDSDSDSMRDGWEVDMGLNPLVDDAGIDYDGDGLLNSEEYRYNSNPLRYDGDNDGLSDFDEIHTYGSNPSSVDGDQDRLRDNVEILEYGTDPMDPDTDKDSIWDGEEVLDLGTNPRNRDSDRDGTPDGWEFLNGFDPLVDDSALDSDEDGFTNLHEYYIGTDPNNADSDADGVLDGAETITYGTNPLNADSDYDSMPDGWEVDFGLNPTLNDSSADADSDALENADEFRYGSDPTVQDSDNDTLLDGAEVWIYQTSPTNADSDADGLDDASELTIYGSDPTSADSDNDDLDDGLEVNTYSTNVTNPDSDSDLMPDGWEVGNTLNPLINDSAEDPDGDTLSNLGEYQNLTDPQNRDGDNDDLQDGPEVLIYGTDPNDIDSDSDGMDDSWEVINGLDPLTDDSTGDLDNDNLSNLGEYQFLSDPNEVDSDNDGIEDGTEVLVYNSNPASEDSDSDGLLDLEEVSTYGSDPTSNDTDQDSLSDFDEVHVYGTNPTSSDTDLDTYPDRWEVDNGFDPTSANVPINEIIIYNAGIITTGSILAVLLVVFILIWRKFDVRNWLQVRSIFSRNPEASPVAEVELSQEGGA